MAACLFLPAFSWAAGLGKLSVISTLGQPLKAEIEIVSLQRGEGDSLTARLASGQSFRQANIEMSPALLSVQFTVERRAGGQHVLMLTSKQPINEPFIDMLVELNWANGRLVREYTFLLDPPEYAPPSQPALAAAPESAAPLESPAPAVSATPEPIAPEPTAAEPAAPGPSASAASPAAESSEPTQIQVLPADVQPEAPGAKPMESTSAEKAPAPPSAESGEAAAYEVKRGDTLSKIAVRNRIEGVSFQQMLVALFRANQDAFVAENMNRLRAGKIVTIPGREAAAAVTTADARRIVSAQYADFNDYRRSLGIAVASTPAPGDAGRRAVGPISVPKETKPPPAKEPTRDELRLSRADDAKKGSKATAGAAAADDLAAKENALREAKERIAILEKNLQDLQKLVQLKSQTGSELQNQAQRAKSGPAEAAAKSPPVAAAAKSPGPAAKATESVPTAGPGAKTDAPKPIEAKGEASKAQPPAGVAKSPAPSKASEAPKPTESAKAPQPPQLAQAPAKAPEAPASEAAKAASKAASKAAAKAAPSPPQVEVSFLDDLLDNPLALGGAGGAMLLLVGYAAYAWRRKRKSQFENSIMSVVPSDADSVLGSEGGRNVDTGSSSFQSDFSQGTISKMDTEEIDPIAEADVYMAYGRDAQAEEILKDALAKDSSRQSIRVKLLEIYANRKDANSFEVAANELYRATGGKGAEWEKVAGLGLSIDPANPLYGGKPAAAGEGFTETGQMAAFRNSEEPAGGAAEPLNIDFDIGASTSGGGSAAPDFNLDAGLPSSESTSVGLDLDLGLGADKTSVQHAIGEIPVPAAISASEPSLSIDFNLPMGDAPASLAPSAATTAVTNLGSIDFDLGTPGGGGDQKTAVSQIPPPLDVGSISLDLGMPGGGGGNGTGGAPDARWQEVATKLDLAKAYEEMGDKDGARELLKEVMREGDMAQQQQAQTMLQGLG